MSELIKLKAIKPIAHCEVCDGDLFLHTNTCRKDRQPEQCPLRGMAWARIRNAYAQQNVAYEDPFKEVY